MLLGVLPERVHNFVDSNAAPGFPIWKTVTPGLPLAHNAEVLRVALGAMCLPSNTSRRAPVPSVKVTIP
jgi:hypothetical protein